MLLKPYKTLLVAIVLCVLQLSLAVFRLFTTNQEWMPAFIGFTYFLVSLVLFGVLVVLLIDLLTEARRTIQGRIINKEGKIIHVLRDDGKLGRYRIIVPEVLETLHAEHRVEIVSTNLANIPSRITVVEYQAARKWS
ncbi:hypothetical protein [Paenibacillus sp. OV219]|uniref:hypothetical protein n=1 Tax=Paenibacillus sp. OV219 TaxID=1884377 RepID=UPI0008D5D905|nr:hypothetical protein [Paenibacillus sp. OV219]SEO36039.1 hypothetical protein SAMN05518847_107195 [Paenibacillus sp. OV219]